MLVITMSLKQIHTNVSTLFQTDLDRSSLYLTGSCTEKSNGLFEFERKKKSPSGDKAVIL